MGAVAHQERTISETVLVALGVQSWLRPIAESATVFTRWTKLISYRGLGSHRDSIVKSIAEYAELVKLFNAKGLIEDAEANDFTRQVES